MMFETIPVIMVLHNTFNSARLLMKAVVKTALVCPRNCIALSNAKGSTEHSPVYSFSDLLAFIFMKTSHNLCRVAGPTVEATHLHCTPVTRLHTALNSIYQEQTTGATSHLSGLDSLCTCRKRCGF